MKTFIFLIIVCATLSTASAQKKTYFVLAYAQTDINLVCGTKIMIYNAEISLTAEEARDYVKKYKAQLAAKYNEKNGYKNLFVEMFSPGTVVIYYDGERVYEQRRDGWECINTWYSHVKATDNLSADKQFARLQAENRKVTYSGVKRWGKPQLESDKTDDLEVRWFTGKTGVSAIITNTRKDVALKITIRSFKASGTNPSLEAGFKNAKQIETVTIVLQPGGKLQQRFDNADGFEVETSAAELKKEKQGLINSIKPLMRQFMKNPNGEIIQKFSGTPGIRG